MSVQFHFLLEPKGWVCIHSTLINNLKALQKPWISTFQKNKNKNKNYKEGGTL